jgi:O-antigen chain-terminating methyltransferase
MFRRIEIHPAKLPDTLLPERDQAVLERETEEARELERDAWALHDLHALGGTIEPPRRRLTRPVVSALRRFGLAVLRPVLEQQSTYNGANARAVSTLRNQTLRHERVLADLKNVVNVLQRAIREQAEASFEFDRMGRIFEREVQRLADRRLDVDQLALTNAFRGTEASVRERQQPYVARFAGRENVLDIGCGRGEFLELLQAAGVAAVGVDADPQMVEHCRAKGLVVERRDALEYVSGLPEGSLGGAFAAQVIEHLTPGDVLRLVRALRRVVAPGGVVLLESPNPEALVTFAEFYVDPTHLRPYNPQAIRWLLEQEGFADVEIELSAEPEGSERLPPLREAGLGAEDFDRSLAHLNELIYGGRTYAVIGTVPPAPASR